MKRIPAIILMIVLTVPLIQTTVFADEQKTTTYKTGVYLVDGAYTYYENGIPSKKTGVVKRLSDNQWVYVRKGKFKKVTGVAKRLKDKKLVYVKNGVFRSYTGLAKKVSNSTWVYVRKGKVETDPYKMVFTAKDRKAGRKKQFVRVYTKALCAKITSSKMTKKQKLRACFNYVSNPANCGYQLNRIPHYFGKDWATVYAFDMIADGASVCFGYAALFGYLASACGYDVYCCNNGGHGWVEINGKIFDPTYAAAVTPIWIYGQSYTNAIALNPEAGYVKLSAKTAGKRRIKISKEGTK